MAQVDRENVKQYKMITKMENDMNSYKGLVLNNEMKVCLMSNPTTVTASCTLCIDIGSFHDPTNLPGLAHLCQRTIVLGTQEYPLYKGFHNFLSDCGNYHGQTVSHQTYYYFEIDSRHFKDALSQYVHFFLTPLLKEDWIEEEIKVLDEEYKQMLMDDYIRLDQFIKSTAKPNYGSTRFCWGDRKSLKTIPEEKGINVRNMLKEFFKYYYSANVMSLCVYSNESVHEIEEIVVKLFSKIPNKNIKTSIQALNPFPNEQLCTEWYIVPKENIKHLKIIFPLPVYNQSLWISALNFIIMLLEFEGRGSLIASLNKMSSFDDMRILYESWGGGICFLIIHIDMFLVENEINVQVNIFIDMLFKYLNMIKKQCNMSSNQQLLELYKIYINKIVDYRSNSTIFHDYKSTFNIAAILHICDMEVSILRGRPEIYFDCTWMDIQKSIKDLFTYSINSKNIRVYTLANDYENEVNLVGPYWTDNAIYKQQKIPEETVSTWNDISTWKFHLPSLHEFEAQYNYTFLIGKYFMY